MSWKEGGNKCLWDLVRKRGRRWEPWERKRERERSMGLAVGSERSCLLGSPPPPPLSVRPHCGGGAGEMLPFGPDQRFRPFVRSIRKYFAKVQSNKVIGERERRRGGLFFLPSSAAASLGLVRPSRKIGGHHRHDVDIRPSLVCPTACRLRRTIPTT